MPSLAQFIYNLAVWLFPVLFAITLHEAAHGWVASKLGDPTAQKLGRITVNPINHIDIMGTIVIPIITYLAGGFVFGWAKPVPVDPRYFKSPLLDMAIVAVAGPLSNFLMACVWALFAMLSLKLAGQTETGVFLVRMGHNGILINVILLVLNLLPVPPLDGGRVLAGLLPRNIATSFMKLEPYGLIIIVLLLVSGILGKIMWPMVIHFIKLIGFVFGV